MAFLQKKNLTYYLCDKSRFNGKWTTKWIKLGKIPFATARAALLKYETDKTYLRLDMQHGRLTIDELRLEYEALQESAPTKQVDTFKREKRNLSIFCKRFGDVQISKLDILAVNKWFVEQKYQPNTIRLHVAALSQLYKLAITNNYLTVNLAAKIYRPKVVKKPPRFVLEKDVEKLFAVMTNAERAPFEIMYYTGVRPSECMRLQARNVNLKTRTLDLYPEQTKTAERGVLPIHDKLIPVFRRLLKDKGPTDFLFPSRIKNIPHQIEIKKVLRSACKRAGVKITPYQFRHTFATRVLEATGDIRVAQQLLRHTNISMTTRYATALEHKLRDAVDKL